MIHGHLSRRSTLSAFAGAVACGAFPPTVRAADNEYTLRLSTSGAAASVLGMAAIRFAQRVGSRTGKRVKIEVYPSSQLGVDRVMIDGLVNGSVDFTITASGFLQGLVAQWQVLELPFLFKEIKSTYRVLDGASGNALLASLDPKGIIGLGHCGIGFREFETAKPIRTVADYKGLRARVVASPVNVATFQALGAIPLTLDVTETFIAIQQHAVDGVDITVDSFFSENLVTYLPYMAMSNHVFGAVPFLASKRKIEGLPRELQNVVREEARAVIPYWRELTDARIGNELQGLRKNGLTITEIDYASFRKAVEPVYAMVQSRIGNDIVEQFKRAAATG